MGFDMMKKSVVCLLGFVLFSQIQAANAEDVVALCLKKEENLTCSDLNYTMTESYKNQNYYGSNDICTPCPIDSKVWSCAHRHYATVISVETTAIRGQDYLFNGCINFPSCGELGYLFTTNQVSDLGFEEYTCSACPFDGSQWACAGVKGLIKPK